MSNNRQVVSTKEVWISGPDGRLFVRIWSPEAPLSEVPLVLFHDSLGSVALWRNFPAELCAITGRKLIAYDRLGFGQSEPYSGKLPLDFVAREAETGFATLVEKLDIDRFILFGHSVGGGMALNCAAKFGDACVAVITESAQAFVEDRTIHGIEEARELFKNTEQIDRLGKYHGKKTAWVLDAWINSWLSPAFASWSLESVLPLVKCPVLAIQGVDDEYGSTRHPELIAQLAGGSVRVEIMAATRHVPHREQEGLVVKMVADFVDTLD